MKIFFLLIVSNCILFSSISLGERKKIAKVKKTEVKMEDLKRIRAISSDENYFYIEITEQELKIIDEARRIFNNADKEIPPPDTLQKKMQDQVGYPEKD